MISVEQVLAVGHRMGVNPTDTMVEWIIFNYRPMAGVSWERQVEWLMHDAFTLELDALRETI